MTDLDARATTTTILSGTETLARLLELRHELDERDGLHTATMVSGYPGSPLGGLDLVLGQRAASLASHRVIHRPALNEELAAATVWGSQMGASVPYAEGVDGVVGAWYGKAPGLDRSGDALKHANAMGAGPNGGAVVFVGDDPSAKSSTLTCDSQHAFEDACLPVLYPGDQQEVLDFGVHAFRLSRYAGPWVGLKIVTAVADGIGSVDLDLDRHGPAAVPELVVDGRPWHHHPQATIGPHAVPDQEAVVVDHRLRAARAYVRHHGLDRIEGAGPGAPVGLVCAGSTYHTVVQALADLGVHPEALADAGIRILKLAMTYPLVEATAVEFASSVDEVVVIEEKRPFIETQLRAALHEAGCPTPVVGKRDGSGETLVSSVGELDPGAVATILGRIRPELAPLRPEPSKKLIPVVDVPGRAPGYCSGCPHNRSTVAPEGALVGGGVGCHGIMYFEARNAGMKRLPPTPMGAEGIPWIGLAPFVDEPHLIQNLGDGTLSHSGTLAIRAAVAAGADMTFKILYNKAVAMTGGQDVAGQLEVPALTRALEAEGVARIVVCAEDPGRYGRRARWAPGVDVHHRDHLDEVQAKLRETAGVTVIIYDQQCAAEARRLRKRGEQDEPPERVFINEAVCEGCGDCSTKSNCLSVLPVDTEFGVKRQIHDLSCNRDYTCLEGDCPSFVTITPAPGATVRSPGEPAPRRNRPALPDGTLPVPEILTIDRQFGICFTGIGGTGVVSANRAIANAAAAAGLVIEGMDQTGLSQKAGAVVSHLHLAHDRDALGSAAVGPGGADLYLSGDVLQAVSPQHLERVKPGRSIAVVDSRVTPTAAMLQTGAAAPDRDELRDAIEDRVGADRTVMVDAQRIAETVFDNHLLANIVLLGAAFQRGGLPLSLDDLETGLHRPGPAGDDNRAAFEWGRWVVQDPEAVAQRLAAHDAGHGQRTDPFDPSDDARERAEELVTERRFPDVLGGLLRRRAAQVVDYQDARLATRYLDLVELAAGHDTAEHGWDLTRAVAEAWFKLLTYKDEYEVARLHLAVDHDEVARDLGIEGDYELQYHLHPPVFRRLGLDRKLPAGKPYEAAFRVLRRMKRLRGTKLDPFGRDRDRKLERALIEEYEQLLRTELVAERLGHDELVTLAASPMSIKGYGPIKEAAAEAWRHEIDGLRDTRGPASPVSQDL